MTDDDLFDELGMALTEPLPSQPSPSSVAAIRAAALDRVDSISRESDRRPPTVNGDASRSSSAKRTGLAAEKAPLWLRAAAVVALVLGGAGIGAWFSTGDQAPETAGVVEFDGEILGEQGARGTLRVVKTGIGRVISIDTSDLAILPTGEYYELWFVAPDDTANKPSRISAGTFHPDSDGRSQVVFAGAVDPALLPVVEITAEPGDGDPGSSGTVVLTVVIN